jgi:hypothetical protein
LNDNVAVFVDPPYNHHHLLHLSDTGIVHCGLRVRVSRRILPSSYKLPDLLIYVDMPTLHDMKYYQRDDDSRWWRSVEDEKLNELRLLSDCVCLRRVYLLHSIRKLNR